MRLVYSIVIVLVDSLIYGIETVNGKRSRRQRLESNAAAEDCTRMKDESICDATRGGVCRNKSCISVCAASLPSLRRCTCAAEEDRFCYLCCGSSNHPCRPAHEYGIRKPNGEMWERDSCARCREWHDGLSCDDREPQRVCSRGKCASNACNGKAEGAHCDLQQIKVCVDDQCSDPCRRVAAHLLTCECEPMSSRKRCQLCCFDPSTKRCESAYERYGVTNRDGRPIYRVGLRCGKHGSYCNKYGLCSSKAASSTRFRRFDRILLTLLVFGFYIIRRAY